MKKLFYKFTIFTLFIIVGFSQNVDSRQFNCQLYHAYCIDTNPYDVDTQTQLYGAYVYGCDISLEYCTIV